MFRKPTYEELEQKVKQLENEVVGFKQTEEALRESEERLSLATRATIDAIWDYDLVLDTVWWNEAYDSNFGTRPKDSRNSWKWWIDHIHPEDRDRVLESIHTALDGAGESWTETYHYRRIDGTYAYVLGRACIARDTSGKARRIFGAMLDFTERNKVEGALGKLNIELEDRVEERTRELEIKTRTLEEINTALNVLLKKRQEDKIALEEKVVGNVKELVMPYLERMKKNNSDDQQKTLLNILESNLNEIISPFSRKLSSKYLNLTPAEIQVADLVRQGKRTKEIAALFNLSYKTVESHRENIRRKIGIKNKKANLRSYLLSLP